MATSIPPPGSSSVELFTSLLTEGLVARGHHVTLFATGTSRTSAELHATLPKGYGEDLSAWPWELCELLNLAAALERASDFDVIHYQAMSWPMSLPLTRLVSVPLVQTRASRAEPRRDRALVALSGSAVRRDLATSRRRCSPGSTWSRRSTTGWTPTRSRSQRTPRDYLLFLGRFTEGQGRPAGDRGRAQDRSRRLILAAPENDYYRTAVAPHVDGTQIIYAGEVGHADEGGAARRRAGACCIPSRRREPFGLVLTEAMACGTPVAALDRGAVREIVEDGITGGIFSSLDDLVAGLPACHCARSRRASASARSRASGWHG